MDMEVSRRGFMKGAGGGVAATTLGALGFGEVEASARRGRPAVQARQCHRDPQHLSLLRGRLRRLIYTLGDLKKDDQAEIVHIEGDADHPTNRGTLCPKGAALLDFVQAPTRLKISDDPQAWLRQVRAGELGYALDRIARLMKDDRDKNFVAKNNDGVTVNRWTTGFLAASATTNETAFCTYKVVRSAGMLAFDNQARV